MLKLDVLKEKFNDPLITIYLILGLLPFFVSSVVSSASPDALAILYALSGIGCVVWFLKQKQSLSNLAPCFLIFYLGLIYSLHATQGYEYWPYIFGFAIVFSGLWSGKVLDLETSLFLIVITSGLMIHVMPALFTNMLEEIDPYYHYKWAELVYDTGKMPLRDWLTYPKLGGLDRSTMPLADSLTLAFFGKIISLNGFGIYDSAMIMPAIAAILTLLVVYFVLIEAYYKHVNAKTAAVFGVFVMMLCVGWSTKAHATDCEDDVFGGLAFMSTMLFFFMALNRDDIKYSVVGGFVFGWLITLYDGQRLLSLVIFATIALMSLIGMHKGKTTFVYLKYFGTIWLIGQIVSRLILHLGEGLGFSLIIPPSIEIAAPLLGILAVAVNEAYVKYKLLSVNKLIIASVVIVVIAGPFLWDQFYKVAVTDNRQASVVFKTIAEQAPFASSVDGYLKSLTGIFGTYSILTLLAVPGLFYIGYRYFKFSYMMFAVWVCVLAWGLYFKSQYLFMASLPFSIVGSFVALFVARSKEDLSKFALIPTAAVILVAFTYLPMNSALVNYDPTGIFFQVAGYERTGWEPALQYFKAQPQNTAIVTWWDYGHWLTSVSKRFVLIDNLQRDHSEIQDVARFFMKETDEEKAFSILRQYQDIYKSEPYLGQFGGVNLKYAAIDWTMVGKSGALRFIATGNITSQESGQYDSYTVCQFLPQYSDVKGSLTAGANGEFVMQKTMTYGCSGNKDGLQGVIFSLAGGMMATSAVDVNGAKIPWNAWIANHNSSLMGVQGPNTILNVCMQNADKINNIVPTYSTFIYASGDFKNVMMSRLYFGEFIDEYKRAGLADVTWGKSEHFTLVQSFENGFVNVWEITY